VKSEYLPYLAIVFLLGGFAAYKDLDSFFTAKRIASTIGRHLPSWIFIVGNGLISVAFLYWSLISGKDSVINQVLLQAESPLLRTLAIALGVPSLLRSRVFGGDGQAAVGVASGYDYLRDKVLHSLNNHTGQRKDKIALTNAQRYQGRADLPDLIWEWVEQGIRPFKTPKEMQEIEDESKRFRKRKAEDSDYTAERYLRDLLRWAMDNVGIKPIERHLKQL
jgi:hypothetical protein